MSMQESKLNSLGGGGGGGGSSCLCLCLLLLLEAGDPRGVSLEHCPLEATLMASQGENHEEHGCKHH